MPELTVAAVVQRQGRYLLVEERVTGRLVLNQPAGHVEAGESLEAAVIREALEETAWSFVPEAIIGVYLWGREGARQPFLRVAFAGHCTAHDGGRALDRGIERVLWLRRSELLARSDQLRSPMVMRAIDDFEHGVRYPLDLFQDLAVEQLTQRAAVL
ncbi:MAG: NUDIX hydrolase [Gammaproteobacteria bacterium]|nr:NUDIX hydrolase [Gammaproteobacteria bacterium]